MKRTSKKTVKAKQREKSVVLKQKTFLRENIKYLFLLLILVSIFIDIYYSFINVKISGEEFLISVRNLLIVPTIIVGVFLVYFEKENITSTINNYFKSKEQSIKLNKIVKSFSLKKALLTNLFFIIIVAISIFALFHKLDYFDIYSDEVQVVRSASGYLHTGDFRAWDVIGEKLVGKPNNRAIPHLWVVAQSFKIFGVSTLSSRLPSAIFGVILIIVMFFIGKVFIKNRTAVLLSIFSFALYFDFLALGRWTRMYAMIYPLFLLPFLFLYKFLNGETKFVSQKLKGNKFVQNYLNFNYLYLLPLLILTVLNLKTHQNTTILFLVFLVFSVISIFVFRKEKKYITASVIGLIILINQIVNPYKVGFSRFTFFEVQNYHHYAKILFGQPFSEYVNVIFIVIGVFILFIIKNNSFKKKYLMLFIINALTYILFGYVFKYASHYRYVSFVTPISVLFIFLNIFIIIKPLYNKYIQAFIVVLVLISVIIKFSNNYDNLYVKNSISPARPSVAHKTIVKKHKKGEVIFRHYGPKIYLKGIDKDTKFIDIAQSKGIKSFYEIFEQIKQHKEGWFIWHTYYSWKVDKSLINYANLYFKKYNGHGIDKTGEEVFYFNEKMLHSIKEFKNFENLPTANLKLSNPYSIVFKLRVDSFTNGNIFTIKNDSIKYVCKIKNKNIIFKTSPKDSIFVKLDMNKDNTITIHQNNINEKTEVSLLLNSNKKDEINIPTKSDFVKFQLNPYFKGSIDKIRLYDFVLNKNQIKTISKDNIKKNSAEILMVNNNEFRTLYLWQKQ